MFITQSQSDNEKSRKDQTYTNGVRTDGENNGMDTFFTSQSESESLSMSARLRTLALESLLLLLEPM